MPIGDVKPRATPSEVLSKMQKGVYRDFAGEGTDTRCPICLDDVREVILFEKAFTNIIVHSMNQLTLFKK